MLLTLIQIVLKFRYPSKIKVKKKENYAYVSDFDNNLNNSNSTMPTSPNRACDVYTNRSDGESNTDVSSIGMNSGTPSRTTTPRDTISSDYNKALGVDSSNPILNPLLGKDNDHA